LNVEILETLMYPQPLKLKF